MDEPTQAAAPPPPPAPTESDAEKARARGPSPWRAAVPAILLAAAAIAAAAWVWYDSRGEFASLRQELAKRIAEADARNQQSRGLAEQLRGAVAEAQVKLGVLESRIADSQSQQKTLEAMYQELSRNKDDWAFVEIEQSLFLASQQLQLAGNVAAALAALQNADTRLQRMARPQLNALRRAINRDLERLKAVPHVDAVALGARLDTVVGQVDALPLAMQVRPPAGEKAAAADADTNPWMRFWREVWSDLRQLVRVQSIDRPEVPLLSPPQAYFLRENLKLRLVSARLALLARDAASFRSDLKASREWLGRYFDTRNGDVSGAMALLRKLQDTEIAVEAPDISATLEALRAARAPRERTKQ